MPTKAADMLIARRADTRARADFATWKMLAKLKIYTGPDHPHQAQDPEPRELGKKAELEVARVRAPPPRIRCGR